jgi:hypothetical protein
LSNVVQVANSAMHDLVHMFVGKKIILTRPTQYELEIIVRQAITRAWMLGRESKQELPGKK